MEAAEALADLLEISSHVEAAVLCDGAGAVSAATLDDDAATALARHGVDLLAAASGLRSGGVAVTRVEVALAGGSLFVVREGDRLVAALTVPDPPAPLVLYDLRTILRTTAPESEPPATRGRAARARKPKDADVPS